MTSRERVSTLLSGKLPDRPPLYDVIRNDAIVEHFAGTALAPETAQQTVIDAHSAALDATKAFYRLPEFEPGKIEMRKDGRKVVRYRWTSWTEHETFESTEDYIKRKTETTAEPWDWTGDDEEALRENIDEWFELERLSGDIVRDYYAPGPPRLDEMFSAVGLEAFSYYMADCPEVVARQIEYRFEKIVQAIEHLQIPSTVLVIGEACDMAFKTGLIFPPSFLKRSFLPGYERFCSAVHKTGRKVLFHSDGDLRDILDDLVDAGIDLLHPVEPLPGWVPVRYTGATPI